MTFFGFTRGFSARRMPSLPQQVGMSFVYAQLDDPSGAGPSRRFAGGVASCNVGLAGPVVGGRAQAAPFSNQDIHFHLVSDDAGGPVGTIASASAPGQFDPGCVAGFSRTAYLFSATVDAAGHLRDFLVRGKRVFFRDQTTIHVGNAVDPYNPASLVNLAGVVPVIAESVGVDVTYAMVNADASGQANAALNFVMDDYYDPSKTFYFNGYGLAPNAPYQTFGGLVEMPNFGLKFRAYTTVYTGSTPNVMLSAAHYDLPNGN